MGQTDLYWRAFEETGSIHSYMRYLKWRDWSETGAQQTAEPDPGPWPGQDASKDNYHDHSM